MLGEGEWFCTVYSDADGPVCSLEVGIVMIFGASPVSMMCKNSFLSPDWLIKANSAYSWAEVNRVGLQISIKGFPKREGEMREEEEEKRDLEKDKTTGWWQADQQGVVKRTHMEKSTSQGKKTQTAGKEPRGWEVGSHRGLE